MKRLSRIPGLKIWTMLLLMAGSLSSCNVLDEEDEDCALYVRFKYDMNMKFADAFQNAVNSVTLYAFKDGVLAYQKTEEGELLKRDGYRMRIDDIPYKKKHEYDYITWAGDTDYFSNSEEKSFTVPVLRVGESTKEDLYCQLNRAGDGIVNSDLQDLFHGQVEGESVSRASSGAASDEVVIPLVKNTNSIRIVLQHLSGKPVDVSKLHFTITDKNGKMNYDNSLLGEDVITYQEWHKAQGSAGIGIEEEGVITEVNLALADLTVARLMADEAPILVVSNEDYEQVIRIPLVDYALMYKRLRYNDMPDQEFLDRQDEYNMTFFLDENYHWINTFVYINSWKIVPFDAEL